MATTTQVTITKTWTKAADGDCTVQSVFSSDLFQIAVNATAPAANAYIQIKINEPVTFAYKTPVWIRLTSSAQQGSTATINVIK